MEAQTFIADLKCHRLVASWIINAPMNRRSFETWIETQLPPTVSKSDVVILDNIDIHESERAEQLVRTKGAWLQLLRTY